MTKTCAVKSCSTPTLAKGYCNMHYKRLLRNGDPEKIVLEQHGKTKSKEYLSWYAMKQRCSNSNVRQYDQYGGRGIAVCDRWASSFTNFLEDMGEKPSPKHTLDRIDVNGDYEPSNCRWATRQQQVINQNIRKDNKSGHKGVFWEQKRQKWLAYMRLDNKFKFLGYFDDIADAAKAREVAEEKHIRPVLEAML